MTFAEWLDTQTDRPGPIGDLAKDFLGDPKSPVSDDLQTILFYVNHEASDALRYEVVAAAANAWLEWWEEMHDSNGNLLED